MMSDRKSRWVRDYARDTARRDGVPPRVYQRDRDFYEEEAAKTWDMMHPPGRENFLTRLIDRWLG